MKNIHSSIYIYFFCCCYLSDNLIIINVINVNKMSKLLIWNKNHIPTSKITRFRSLNKTKKVIQIYKKKNCLFKSF